MALVNYTKILRRLQNTWLICFGAFTAATVLGYWVPHVWQPLVVLGFAIMIVLISKNVWERDRRAYCALMVHYTVCTMLLSAVVMFVINLINTHWLRYTFTNLSTTGAPFISSLVIYPVATILFAFSLWRRSHTEYCKACRQRAGYSIRETLEGNVFHHEAHWIIRYTLILSATLAGIVWAYYFIFYINVNINSPDTFFYFAVPAAVYILGVYYVCNRYATMKFEITMAPGHNGLVTMVRYMVIRDGEILLNEIVADSQNTGLWDTPAVLTLPFTETLSDKQAREEFVKLADTEDFTLRRLFTTNTTTHNAFHFVVILDTARETVESVGEDLPLTSQEPVRPLRYLEGDWFNLYEVDMMMKQGHTTRPFAYEMHRIYTMTMAWKTYDRQGKRLYPIKNYRPTFRLVDFKTWDVDYSDLHWLNVANNNEDKPFWRLRKFWRRYVSNADKL